MQVSKNILVALQDSPRIMTKETMQKDFEYEMVQKITRNMLNQGLISIDEYDRILVLNA